MGLGDGPTLLPNIKLLVSVMMRFHRAISLAVILIRAQAIFPTWTQDTPNKNGMPLTELSVAIGVTTSAATLQDDVLLLSYERAAPNDTDSRSALPIESGLADALVAQQGNATTGSVAILANGTRVLLVRMNLTSGSPIESRKLGATLASTVQTAVSSDSPQTCSIDLSDVNLTTVEEWTEMAASLWKGFYKDVRFRGPDTTKLPVHSLTLIVDPEHAVEAKEGLKRGRILAEAVALSRDVVNAPHNVLNSLSLAQTAQTLARKYRRTLSCQILTVDQCEALGMGAFLGVGKRLLEIWKRRKNRTRCISSPFVFDTQLEGVKRQPV